MFEPAVDGLGRAVGRAGPVEVGQHVGGPLCEGPAEGSEFGQRCREAGIRPSMGTVGDALDNAMCESFFATLKEELLYRGVWPTRSAARRAIFEYVEVFYNRQRMHSSLDYLTPVDYEARRRDSDEAQAA